MRMGEASGESAKSEPRSSGGNRPVTSNLWLVEPLPWVPNISASSSWAGVRKSLVSGAPGVRGESNRETHRARLAFACKVLTLSCRLFSKEVCCHFPVVRTLGLVLGLHLVDDALKPFTLSYVAQRCPGYAQGTFMFGFETLDCDLGIAQLRTKFLESDFEVPTFLLELSVTIG